MKDKSKKIRSFLKEKTLVFARKMNPKRLLSVLRQKMKGLKLKIITQYKEKRIVFMDMFSNSFYGVRLLKPRVTKIGYVLTTLCLYAVLLTIPKNILDAFGYVNFTEQSLVITTVLLTVLLSAGFVFLGDDTRGWSLARLTIIKDVIKLKGLIIAVALICIVSILPDYRIYDFSLKTLLAPVLVVSFLYILGIFVRVYRWLSDLAADPSLFEENAEESESRSFHSSSYRFARIVYLIHHNNRRDAWQSILERKIPEGYEELIHEEFFEASDNKVKSRNKNKLQEVSIMLEIYDKYYSRRNLDSWRFYLDYTKRFLLLYASVMRVDEEKSNDTGYFVINRGRMALERIISQLVSSSFTSDKIWHLFDAMDEYIKVEKLTELRGNQIKDNKVLSNFVDTFFDTVLDDNFRGHEIGSYTRGGGNWQITTKALYNDENNIGWVLLKHFESWLFKKLEQNEDNDFLTGVDQLVGLIFPEVEPIDFGRLYWFMFNAKNTSNMKRVVGKIYEDKRPIGNIGRMFAEFEITSKGDDIFKKSAKKRSNERDAGVELFARTHANFFTDNYWNIDLIIDEAEKKIENSGEDDRKANEVRILIEHMKAIRDVLASETDNKGK